MDVRAKKKLESTRAHALIGTYNPGSPHSMLYGPVVPVHGLRALSVPIRDTTTATSSWDAPDLLEQEN